MCHVLSILYNNMSGFVFRRNSVKHAEKEC